MVWVIKGVVVLIGALFLFMGMDFLIDPMAGAANFFITPEGVAGLNTVRGDIAGLFLALGVFSLLGLKSGAQHWLYAAVILLGLIASGRVVGFVFDGTAESTVTAFVAELVLILLLVVAALRLKTVSSHYSSHSSSH